MSTWKIPRPTVLALWNSECASGALDVYVDDWPILRSVCSLEPPESLEPPRADTSTSGRVSALLAYLAHAQNSACNMKLWRNIGAGSRSKLAGFLVPAGIQIDKGLFQLPPHGYWEGGPIVDCKICCYK